MTLRKCQSPLPIFVIFRPDMLRYHYLYTTVDSVRQFYSLKSLLSDHDAAFVVSFLIKMLLFQTLCVALFLL